MAKLTKLPGEKRRYAVDFSLQTELVNGETLTSNPAVTVTRISGDGALTVTNVEILTSKVVFWLEGGEAGDTFQVLAQVSTSSGARLGSAHTLTIATVS